MANSTDKLTKSQLELSILKYKQSQKLIRVALILGFIILVLLLILLLNGFTLREANENTTSVVEAYKDVNFPEVGENGNWWINGSDTGISAKGEDGKTVVPEIGPNGNWWINGQDTGITAAGADGADGADGERGATGADGADGQTGDDGSKGDKGDKGEDGKTPYIGANGNWWIGDVDTGISAVGQGSGGQGGEQTQNSFTIDIDSSLHSKGIALSETKSFANPTPNLSCLGIQDSWNITYSDIPDGLDTDMGGSKNGTYYIAYTFFLKNTGDETLDYDYTLNLLKNTKGALDAVRVGLYVDGELTRYASPNKLGQKENFACDESFSGDTKLINKTINNFESGDVTRYTILLWYEGNDPECINEILGGGVSMTLDFGVK